MGLSATVKRTSRGAPVLAVCMVLAATLAMPSPAGADSVSVRVIAQIAPTFSLTLLSDGTVSFGEVTVGQTYEAAETQTLEVRSSRPWDFSDSSDPTISVGGVTVPRDRVVRHVVTPGFGEGRAAGTHTIQCRYILDLTTPEAFSLPRGVPIATTFGYTVVQR